jgi:hypothetical protein
VTIAPESPPDDIAFDWLRFQGRNLNDASVVEGGSVAAFCCGDPEQALIWRLRDAIGADGRVDRKRPPAILRISLPGLRQGNYRITCWDTEGARVAG